MKNTVTVLLLIAALLLSAVPAAAAESPDPYLDKQTNLERISYQSAWDMGLDGRGVRIAVIDSGIYSEHEDLAGANILPGVNVIDRSGKIHDTSGHGTFISAMLAAPRNNGKGTAGMVDGATIVPLKCFSAGKQTEARYIVSAIYMAVDQYNCDIINLSLGIADDIPALRQAVDYAAEKGVIIVAAAGNTGGTAKVYPAAYENVIGVGSVSGSNKTSYFSQRNDSVFVVAPGENIFSAGISGRNAYMEGSGTSFSAVHVTALAAIAKQYDRNVDTGLFKLMLRESALDLGDEGYDTKFGWGLVDTPAFLSALKARCHAFTDVSGHWAEEYITRAAAEGLFSGVSSDLFDPDGSMTRAMAATVFYRLAGAPVVTGSAAFSDVGAGEWYSSAVAWAAQNGIVMGTYDGRFLPHQNISRQELAVMLHRYAAYLKMDTKVSAEAQFSDSGAIAPWSSEAVNWCVSEGLCSGRPSGEFAPGDSASRAEVAAVVCRFLSYTSS